MHHLSQYELRQCFCLGGRQSSTFIHVNGFGGCWRKPSSQSPTRGNTRYCRRDIRRYIFPLSPYSTTKLMNATQLRRIQLLRRFTPFSLSWYASLKSNWKHRRSSTALLMGGYQTLGMWRTCHICRPLWKRFLGPFLPPADSMKILTIKFQMGANSTVG